MFTLKVDNMYYKTTKEMLQDDFGRFGEVGDVYIPRDPRYNFIFLMFVFILLFFPSSCFCCVVLLVHVNRLIDIVARSDLFVLM